MVALVGEWMGCGFAGVTAVSIFVHSSFRWGLRAVTREVKMSTSIQTSDDLCSSTRRTPGRQQAAGYSLSKNRPGLGWSIGGRLLCLAAIVSLLAAVPGCGSERPPPPPVEPPPAPEPEPIKLGQLEPLELLPASTGRMSLSIDRQGNQGEIKVTVEGLPSGVTAAAKPIPAGASAGELVLKASADTGDAELTAHAKVTVSVGGRQAVQPLSVRVKKVTRPEFGKVSAVLVQPGGKATVTIPLQKNGFAGELPLKVEGGRKDIQAKVAAGDGQVELRLAAGDEVPDCSAVFAIGTSAYGQKLSVSVPVEVSRFPFRVDSFRVVGLNPGETDSLTLNIQRPKFSGPLDVAVENLPDGVTAARAKVPAEANDVVLELACEGEARPRVRSCRVVASGGGMQTDNALIVRVLAEDQEELPAGIIDSDVIKAIFNNNPAKSAPLRRRGSIGGRLTLASKQALMDFFGGTPESQTAVMKGLDWLAGCQRYDGSWSLDGAVDDAGENGQAASGPAANPVGATALALLPFLSEGITHNRMPEGQPELEQYQSVVERGLIYLGQLQQQSGQSGELPGGMYAHALATIVFCEAYGISGDERLRLNAQYALKYLLNAQHSAGGWRYGPGQPGDMSATGWVFLAIRSAQLTGISVLQDVLRRAERFIDTCAVGPPEAPGSRYTYLPTAPERPEKRSLTAAGLLTREYLGWRQDEANLAAGAEYLMKNLPPERATSVGDMYYYYYATQVLHHLEGDDFDLWNYRIRQHLLRNQEQDGETAGSWSPEGVPHGDRGGRIYATSLALLTLQVYYRHLPMYRPIKFGGRK